MFLDGMSQVEGTPEGLPEANESFQGRGHGKRLTLVPPLQAGIKTGAGARGQSTKRA